MDGDKHKEQDDRREKRGLLYISIRFLFSSFKRHRCRSSVPNQTLIGISSPLPKTVIFGRRRAGVLDLPIWACNVICAPGGFFFSIDKFFILPPEEPFEREKVWVKRRQNEEKWRGEETVLEADARSRTRRFSSIYIYNIFRNSDNHFIQLHTG